MSVKGLVLSERAYIDSATPPDAFEDESRFGNNGVHTNITWVKNPTGLWLREFNGSSSLIDCGNHPSLSFAIKDNFMLKCWIKQSSSAVTKYLLSKGKDETGSGGNGIYALISLSGVPHFGIFDGSWYYAFNNDTTIDDDIPHLICGVRTQTEIKLYVDGVHIDSTNMGAIDLTGTGRLIIGGTWLVVASFIGSLSLFEFNNYAPSAEQIDAIFQAERHWLGL